MMYDTRIGKCQVEAFRLDNVMWKCVLKFHVYLDVQYLDIAVYPISDAKRYQNQVTESDTRRHGTGLIYIVFGSIENEQCMCSLHMTT